MIALAGGELLYFLLSPSGELKEYHERKEMSSEVVCMALANVPPGEQCARFLAVSLADRTVRIISLDTANCFSALSIQVRNLIHFNFN